MSGVANLQKKKHKRKLKEKGFIGKESARTWEDAGAENSPSGHPCAAEHVTLKKVVKKN